MFYLPQTQEEIKTRAEKDNVTFVKETSIPVIRSMYEFRKTKPNIPDGITIIQFQDKESEITFANLVNVEKSNDL